MAPIRRAILNKRRRSSITLLRRRSLIAPKSFTFAPNVTPISYPSDPYSPSDDPIAQLAPADGAEVPQDVTQSQEASRPRRRNGRKNSIAHIPRPPNAFMLFRQNFVHQRHVPGSIETNHHSLSRIVGNCWKALPASEKKVWEVLAEKKKEEHKRMYPDYRFQPKHDPEKKRKRQAARVAAEKAERDHLARVRLEEEARHINGLGGFQPTVETFLNSTIDDNHVLNAPRSFLGLRRPSSVPLPSGAHGFGANPYGLAHADPFNFANPALAHTAQGSNNAGGIALPTLPTHLNKLHVSRTDTTMDGAPNALNDVPSFPPTQNVDVKVTDATLSSLNLHTSNGMSFTANNMQTLGMGARAARQHQLGQLGRRASSTQPILQHQYASGAFPHMNLFATANIYSQAPVFNAQVQSYTDSSGFLGDIAEGFTNPFAQPQNEASSGDVDGANSRPSTATYSNPIPPDAVWYRADPVDPMSSAVGSTSSPSSDGYCDLHQQQQRQEPHAIQNIGPSSTEPSFQFSAVPASPQDTPLIRTGARTSFGLGLAPIAPSELAFNMRDSFDFTAFNEVFTSMTQSRGQESVPSVHPQTHLDSYHQVDDVAPHVMLHGSPPHANDGFTLAQPVPVRKVAAEDLPSNQSPYAQSYYVLQQQQPYASTATTNNSGSATPTEHDAAQRHAQQHSPSYENNDYVTGHELLDTPINVLNAGTGDFSYELALGLDMNLAGVGNSLCPDVHLGMNYGDYASVSATETPGDVRLQGQAQQQQQHYGVNENDLEQVGKAPEPYFSFGDYDRSLPFAVPAVVY